MKNMGWQRQTRRTFKACRALFRTRITEQIQYRAAALASTSIGVFWGILQIVMFTVFFTYGNVDNIEMTLPQAVSYAWLAQMLLGVIGAVDMDGELREKITSGNVSLELCRPLDLYSHWFAKTAAFRLGRSVWRMVFTLAAALIVPAAMRLSMPDSVVGFALFLLSVCSAFLLSAAFVMVLASVRMGLTWGEGPIYALGLLAGLLSGTYLPLQLWPDFLQTILLLQPFAGLMDIPLRLYIGSMPPEEALWAISLQLIWAVVFIIIGRTLMSQKLKGLIVQGG